MSYHLNFLNDLLTYLSCNIIYNIRSNDLNSWTSLCFTWDGEILSNLVHLGHQLWKIVCTPSLKFVSISSELFYCSRAFRSRGNQTLHQCTPVYHLPVSECCNSSLCSVLFRFPHRPCDMLQNFSSLIRSTCGISISTSPHHRPINEPIISHKSPTNDGQKLFEWIFP
jgi:hypothetical protein